MAALLGDAARWVGRQGLRAVAPDWWTFTDRRRFAKPVRARPPADAAAPAKLPFPWSNVLWLIATCIGWVFMFIKERRLRAAARLASATPLVPLRALRRALRDPVLAALSRGDRAALAGAPAADASGAELVVPACGGGAAAGGTAGLVQGTRILTLAGNCIFGPQDLDCTMLIADLQRRVAETLGQPSSAVRLVFETRILDPCRTAVEERLPADAEITVVVSRDREQIADALFARARGTIWLPDGAFALAPFSGRHVAFVEAQVVRLYDEWLTTWERRCVKHGRAAGTNGKDDPGEDAEYEDVQRHQWMPREEVVQQIRTVAPQVFLDDGSGERAVLMPSDMVAWARENSELTFSETEAAARDINFGALALALVNDVRERGTRREERTLQVGDACEVVGEACITERGLVLREPRLPSDVLHRVDSEGLLGDRPSSLPNKKFAGLVLRAAEQSLERVKLGSARWYRVGKWIFGVISLAFAYKLGRRWRVAKRLTRALGLTPRAAAA